MQLFFHRAFFAHRNKLVEILSSMGFFIIRMCIKEFLEKGPQNQALTITITTMRSISGIVDSCDFAMDEKTRILSSRLLVHRES